MKVFAFLAIFLQVTSVLYAQNQLSQVVNGSVNLSPRFQRGNLQEYTLTVDYAYLEDDGTVRSNRENLIKYRQLCLQNEPDTAVLYELTLVEFMANVDPEINLSFQSGRILKEYEGYTFESRYGRAIPTRDSCYQHNFTFGEELAYRQSYELVEHFIPIELLEQFRFMGNRRLTRIGDTLTVKMPVPICFEIPRVINRYYLKPSPFNLRLSGITSFWGVPCAVVQVSCATSPLEVEIYSTSETSFRGKGTTWLQGEFLISLENGELLQANLTERIDSKILRPDGEKAVNRVWKSTKLIQTN